MTGYTTRANPQIAASELADFMEASDPARNTILVSAKHRASVRVRTYAQARTVLAADVITGRAGAEAIRARAARMREAHVAESLARQESEMNAELLEHYAAIYPRVQIPGARFIRPPQRTWRWSVGGMTVSISPHFATIDTARGGRTTVGASVFEYSKGKPYKEAIAKWFGTLLYIYAENVLAHEGEADCRLSGCLDVQAGRYFFAPARRARLIGQMEAACVGIAQRWPSIPPR